MLNKKIKKDEIQVEDAMRQSNMTSMHSSQFGQAQNTIENDENERELNSRLISQLKMKEMNKDLLKDYNSKY